MRDESINKKLSDISISRKRKPSFRNSAFEYDPGYCSDDEESDDDVTENCNRSFKKLKIDIEIDTSNHKNYVPIKKYNGTSTSRVYKKAFNLIKRIKDKKKDEDETYKKDLDFIESKIRTSNGFAGDMYNNRDIVFLPCNCKEKIIDNNKIIK